MDHSSHHTESPTAGMPEAMNNDVHGHPTAFHFGASEVVLFDFWRTESAGGNFFIRYLID